jgi:hypothetical protein
MKKIIRLTESELTRIIKRIIKEQSNDKQQYKLDLDKFDFNMDDEEYDDNIDRITDKFLDDLYSINYMIENINQMVNSVSSFEDPTEDDYDMMEEITNMLEDVRNKLRDLEDYYYDKMEPNEIEKVDDKQTGIYGNPLELIHSAFDEIDSIENRPY